MVICKYYREGRCKFGDSCRYEHIDPPRGGAAGVGAGPTADPFAAPSVANGRTSNQQGRPQWPLSAVALPDPAAGNALGGDMSAEEVRVQAYAAAPRGRAEAVAQQEVAMVNQHKAREAALAPHGTADPFAGRQTEPFAMTATQAPPLQDPFTNSSRFGAQQQQPENMFAAPASQFASTQTFAQNAQPFNAAQMNAAPVATAGGVVAPTAAPISTEAEAQYSAMQFGFRKVPEQAPPPRFY